MTVADVEECVGVQGFLDDLRARLRTGAFRAMPVRERTIPKARRVREGPQARYSDGLRKPRGRAKAREDSGSFLTVTHPFHPLAGRRLRVLFQRRYKPGGIAFCCEGGLAFCCEGGPAGSVMLPVAWTDRGEPAADRAQGCEQLVDLAAMVGVLATRGGAEVVDV